MGRLRTRHGPVSSNPPWACLRIRHKRLCPVPSWQLQQLGRPVWRIRHTTPDGPPWLADLGLRRWYTYLVYPQHILDPRNNIENKGSHMHVDELGGAKLPISRITQGPDQLFSK
jgi:hypothetical protein